MSLLNLGSRPHCHLFGAHTTWQLISWLGEFCVLHLYLQGLWTGSSPAIRTTWNPKTRWTHGTSPMEAYVDGPFTP